MIYPQHISLCTSAIENAGYENRMSGVVRGRRLVTASYSIEEGETINPKNALSLRSVSQRY